MGASEPSRVWVVLSSRSPAGIKLECDDSATALSGVWFLLGRKRRRFPGSVTRSRFLPLHILSLVLVSALLSIVLPLLDSVGASAATASPRDRFLFVSPTVSSFRVGSKERRSPFKMATARTPDDRALHKDREIPFLASRASGVATKGAFSQILRHHTLSEGQNHFSDVDLAPLTPDWYSRAERESRRVPHSAFPPSEEKQSLLAHSLGKRGATPHVEPRESSLSTNARVVGSRIRDRPQDFVAPNAMSFINWQMLGATMLHPALQVTGSPLTAPPIIFHQPDPAVAMSQHGKVIAVAAACMVAGLVIMLFCCFMVRRKRAHEAYMAKPLILPNQA